MPFDGDRDISQMVAEAFWQHRKDVSTDVIPKVLNTERYFRYIKMNHPHLFIKLPQDSKGGNETKGSK